MFYVLCFIEYQISYELLKQEHDKNVFFFFKKKTCYLNFSNFSNFSEWLLKCILEMVEMVSFCH